jgi:hypothetical protein
MLRMRPKPPAGLPTINAGTPWSAMDMADLEEFLTSGTSGKESRWDFNNGDCEPNLVGCYPQRYPTAFSRSN